MSDWLALGAFLIVTLAVGGAAAWATSGGVRTWYPTLIKPSFNPPNWVFAPVWTALYILMAVAAWRVWQQTGLASLSMLLFFVQLALNGAWSVIFFNAHRIAAALVDIVILTALIVLTMVSFAAVDPLAAWLMAPYLAWVSFATLLNAAIFRLNPAAVA
jgi:translocator protein